MTHPVRILVALVLVISLSVGTACSEDEGAFALGPNAQLDWTPGALVFGDVPRGEESRRYVTLRHIGTSGVDGSALMLKAAQAGVLHVIMTARIWRAYSSFP